MDLSDTIKIAAPVSRVFNFFEELDKNYLRWHPDHLGCKLLAGRNIEAGTIMCFEEKMHGKPHSLKFKITWVETGKIIEYANFFPFSMISSGGFFKFVQIGGDSCEFIAGMNFKGGKFLSNLFRTRIEALKKHMKEEGENLKKIMESRF